MAQYLKVKNWENYQHYKDRNPPWIKLHRDLLNDYSFSCLQDASKLHLMLIWLLASQMDNKIPADSDFIKRRINVDGDIDFKPLIDNGFLIDASNALAGCKQVAMLETEAEAEAEIIKSTQNKIKEKKPNAKETRMPEDWLKSEECYKCFEWAKGKFPSSTEYDIKSKLAEFSNYWTSKGEKRIGWYKTFQNNCNSYGIKAAGTNGQSGGGGKMSSVFSEVVARRKAGRS